jgi:Kef-type K+ transport system membrane component KefB
MIGMVLAGTVGKDHSLIRRLRTLTFGLLTPFYFIRAGSFVLVPVLIAAPAVMLILFLAKSLTKAIAVYPAVRAHRYEGNSGAYYTLMMSTGLTFGTISALFGLNHNIIDQKQYSWIVGTVIASAVIPTMIANSFFLPRHLLPHAITGIQSEQSAQPAVAAEKA